MTRKYRKISVQNARRVRGFSIFELILYLLISSIIFSISMRRFEQYPADAERANFLSILGQLKSAVTLQMMNGIAGGTFDEMGRLENSNPMALMLETPTNYAGAFSLVDEGNMPRRTWYFDSYNGQLVYLASPGLQIYSAAGDGSGSMNSIRFRVINKYSEVAKKADEGLGIDAGQVTGLSVTGTGGSAATGGKWEGLVLEPVTPYNWNPQGISLSGIEVPPQ
ncbi:MAG: hypothetical protein Q7U82_14275 [Gammaproteobacteria bacterium]|nr:hypothetical protein [Gammaproteobacteria bacterium]